MNSSHHRSGYNARLQKVLDHINRHLDGELSLQVLCEIACFSPFHFHRQFRHAAGLPLNQYIRLVRLKQACYQLAYDHDRSVGDISAGIGFENAESFSRAFRQALDLSPLQFREQADWDRASRLFSSTRIDFSQENMPMQVRIVTLPSIPVAALSHRGNPHRLHNSVRHFIEWRKSSGQSPVAASMTLGIPWNDPEAVPAGEFRFDICGSLQEGEAVEPNDFDVKHLEIPGGRFAVLRHHGSTDLIGPPVYRLYGEWLPESGEELREFPCFFHYIERMPQVAEHEQVTDIYLPLR